MTESQSVVTVKLRDKGELGVRPITLFRLLSRKTDNQRSLHPVSTQTVTPCILCVYSLCIQNYLYNDFFVENHVLMIKGPATLS